MDRSERGRLSKTSDPSEAPDSVVRNAIQYSRTVVGTMSSPVFVWYNTLEQAIDDSMVQRRGGLTVSSIHIFPNTFTTTTNKNGSGRYSPDQIHNQNRVTVPSCMRISISHGRKKVFAARIKRIDWRRQQQQHDAQPKCNVICMVLSFGFTHEFVLSRSISC